MTQQVVVTRPAREAVAWQATLSAAGFDPVALPLLAFGPPSCTDALTAARRSLHTFDAVMFVSPQAVQAFFAENNEQKMPSAVDGKALTATENNVFQPHQRGWAPGPGTAQALVAAGLPAACIDQPAAQAAQFDSEALWSVVRHQLAPGSRVLVVRGEGDAPTGPAQAGQGAGREWLADQCRAAGAQVHMCAAYRRQLPCWTPDQCAAAVMAASNGAVWLFSSSEGATNLKRLLPGQVWQHARAVATHPRIAQAVRALGFGCVQVCRPAQADVLQTLHNGSSDAVTGGRAGCAAPKMA